MSTRSDIFTTVSSCKERGNKLFSAGKFGAATDAYTEGITLLPKTIPTGSALSVLASMLYSNRSLASKSAGRPAAEVLEDARRAVQYDKTNVKGHHLLGLSLESMGAHAAATARLDRAALEAERKKAFVVPIASAAAAARAAWFESSAVAEAEADEDLLRSCMRALAASSESKVRLPRPRLSARYDATSAAASSDARGGSVEEDTDNDARLALLAEAYDARTTSADALEALFEARRVARANRVIPDYFCDPVSLDIMLDPVLSPAGVSFDRATVIECLKIKEECPVTRTPLRARDLIPNRALKQAVSDYLRRNPWAHPDAGRN